MSIRYIDTRGAVEVPLSFSEALIKGLAPGGGLFVPQEIPVMTLDEITSLGTMPYWQRAASVYERFGVDFERCTLDKLFATIYSDNFDDPAICPIRAVGDDGVYVLELWHGPTSAFKDMALQCLPVFFSESVNKQRAAGGAHNDYLIAVATSGDTGKAALQGFADRDHTFIVVYYPDGGVSDIQFKQMATQCGANVCVYGVRGNFDDCQTSVKRMFNDDAFNALLRDQYKIALSSANSINWGRLLPQIVYYISSYAQLVCDGVIACGDPIDVTVPTGNFGNILASWYAQCIGTPIDNIVCASNENRVLTDFIETGTYTIADRKFLITPSPSMDILVSSNLERQLFELTGRDSKRINQWMADLREKGEFTIDKTTFAALQKYYVAGSVTSKACLKTIKQVYDERRYLLDPHTAVAWKVALDNKGTNPMLVVSTAHWAKFGANVYRALTALAPGEDLPEKIQVLTGAQLNREVQAIAPDAASIPSALDELDDMNLRFREVIDGKREALESSVTRFLDQQGLSPSMS